MNISVRKLLCALMCGAFVLTVVPAKAEFRISEWFTPKAALVTAGILAACWFIKKCFSGPISIANIVELSCLKNFQQDDLFSVVEKIDLAGNNPFETNFDALPVGTYKIVSRDRYKNKELNVDDITVKFESNDKGNRYTLIFKHGTLDTIALASQFRAL